MTQQQHRAVLWRALIAREIRRLLKRGEKVQPELLRWAGIESS